MHDVRRFVLVFAVLVGAGCSSEAEDVISLDCERDGYPCRWADVSAEIWRETNRLGVASAELVSSGARSVEDVVRELKANPRVAEVQSDGRVVRFRLDGGRPAWLAWDQVGDVLIKGGSASPVGAFPLPAIVQSPNAAAETSVTGAGRGKRALFLAPYAWEFGEAKGEPVGWMRGTRQYRTRDGGQVDFFANVADPYVSSPDTGNIVQGTVGLEHFRVWDSYDFVHVSTHGSALCDDAFERCWTRLSAGKFFDPDSALDDLLASEVGIVVRYGGRSFLSDSSCAATVDAVLAGPVPDDCAAGSKQATYASLSLETDFFRAAYPRGLDKTIVFLDACQSMRVGDLADVLVTGDDAFLIGFNRLVPANHRVLVHVIDLLQKNVRTHEWEAKLDTVIDALEFAGGLSRTADAGGAAPGAARQYGERGADLWARDLVHLLDPATGEELEDGATLRVQGTPQDETADALETQIRLRGIDESSEVSTLSVQVSVDGRTSPTGFSVDRRIDDYLWGGEDEVQLGLDIAAGTSVDIALWAELPNGEETRWRYRDIRLEFGAWSLNVTGGTRAGRYSGPRGWVENTPDGGVGTIVLHGPDERERYAMVEIRPERPIREPGSFRTDAGCIVEIAFFRMADAFAANGPPEDPALCTGQATRDAEDAKYPDPSTVRITELSDDWVAGSVTGTFYVQSPVHHPDRRADVTLRFRVPRR